MSANRLPLRELPPELANLVIKKLLTTDIGRLASTCSCPPLAARAALEALAAGELVLPGFPWTFHLCLEQDPYVRSDRLRQTFVNGGRCTRRSGALVGGVKIVDEGTLGNWSSATASLALPDDRPSCWKVLFLPNSGDHRLEEGRTHLMVGVVGQGAPPPDAGDDPSAYLLYNAQGDVFNSDRMGFKFSPAPFPEFFSYPTKKTPQNFFSEPNTLIFRFVPSRLTSSGAGKMYIHSPTLASTWLVILRGDQAHLRYRVCVGIGSGHGTGACVSPCTPAERAACLLSPIIGQCRVPSEEEDAHGGGEGLPAP